MDSGTCAGVPLGVPLGVDPSVDTRRALVADSWLRPNHSLVRMCHFGSCCLVGLSSLVISLTCTALWLGRFSAMFDFVKLSEGRFAKLHTLCSGVQIPLAVIPGWSPEGSRSAEPIKYRTVEASKAAKTEKNIGNLENSVVQVARPWATSP